MRFRSASIALLSALVACGACGACGGPGRPAKATTGRSAEAAPLGSAAAARAASHAALRAGTSGDYPPLSIWKDDRVEGFAPSLVSAFATAQKMEVGWTRFRWPALSDDFRSGRFDLAADGITVRPERSIGGRFSVPIARGGAVLLVRHRATALPAAASDADPLARLAALDRPDLHVLVNQGGHLERVARSLLHAADIRAIGDNDAVRAAFARGDGDAAMTNTFEAPRWMAEAPGAEPVGPLTTDVTAIWIRADHGELADRLDAWLLDEEESGRLAALRARWLGPGAGTRAASAVSALLAATEERLALMPFVAAAKQRTGKAVEDVAQEERVLAASADAVTKAAQLRGAAPPRRELVDAFFRAQIAAAKAVQQRAAPAGTAATFSLDEELRPAIARISARMAALVVRVPRDAQRAAVVAEARVDLASTGLDAAHIDELAAAIAGLAAER